MYNQEPQKPFYETKWFAAVITIIGLIIVFYVAANGGDNNAPNVSTQAENANSDFATGEGEIGNYYIKIKSAQWGKDYEDRDCIIVTYEWTNNDKDATSFMFAFKTTAYQDGIECAKAISVDGVDTQNQMKDIKKGTTFEVKVAYLLNDTETNVEIEVGKLIDISIDKVLVKKVFTLS